MRYFLFFSFFSLSMFVKAQAPQQRVLDLMDYEPLLTLYDEFYGDSISQEKIARTYLKKARADKDTIKMARGYDRLARFSKFQKSLSYCDSIIFLTKDKTHVTYPALGFLIKGNLFRDHDKDKRALDNYIEAYKITSERNNAYLQLSILSEITNFVQNWGDNSISKKLIRIKNNILNDPKLKTKLIKGFRKKNPPDSIVDIEVGRIYCDYYFDLLVYYIGNKQIDSAKFYADSLIEKSLKSPYYAKNTYYSLGKEGLIEIDFYNSDYKSALTKIDTFINNKLDYGRSLKNIYFFKGMSYLGLSESKLGIESLLKADSLATIESILPYQLKM